MKNVSDYNDERIKQLMDISYTTIISYLKYVNEKFIDSNSFLLLIVLPIIIVCFCSKILNKNTITHVYKGSWIIHINVINKIIH